MLIPRCPFPAALITVTPRFVGDFGGVREDNPSLAAGHELKSLETKSGRDAKTPNRFSAPDSPVRMGGIFEQRNSMLFGNRTESIHIRWMPAEMNGIDG